MRVITYPNENFPEDSQSNRFIVSWIGIDWDMPLETYEELKQWTKDSGVDCVLTTTIISFKYEEDRTIFLMKFS